MQFLTIPAIHLQNIQTNNRKNESKSTGAYHSTKCPKAIALIYNNIHKCILYNIRYMTLSIGIIVQAFDVAANY